MTQVDGGSSNLRSRFNVTYKYDAENQLVKVSDASGYVARFAVDGDGNRRKRIDSFGTVIYAGPHYERNVGTGADTSDVTTKQYWAQLGPFKRLIAVRKGGTLSFLHHDHLGSTKAVSGTTGGPMKYYPFGSTYQEIDSPPTDNLYTGQKRDLSTGLYFYGARYMNPATGMFTQPDTIVPQPGDPQSLNRFAYCQNNPIGYTDPTGHAPIPGPGTQRLQPPPADPPVNPPSMPTPSARPTPASGLTSTPDQDSLDGPPMCVFSSEPEPVPAPAPSPAYVNNGEDSGLAEATDTTTNAYGVLADTVGAHANEAGKLSSNRKARRAGYQSVRDAKQAAKSARRMGYLGAAVDVGLEAMDDWEAVNDGRITAQHGINRTGAVAGKNIATIAGVALVAGAVSGPAAPLVIIGVGLTLWFVGDAVQERMFDSAPDVFGRK